MHRKDIEMSYYIEVKDKKIPTIVRNYSNMNSIKIFFKGNVLNISKPKRTSIRKMLQIIKENEEEIYKQYVQINSLESKAIKHWNSGEKILYKGEEFQIERKSNSTKKVLITLDAKEKKIKIDIPEIIQDDFKRYVDKGIKNLFKNNTQNLIQERLPYWSKVTKIPYNNVKINDTSSKFGSCKPATKDLYFSARLIMLPQDKVDAIIVHELCHIVYANHSKDFYDLVKKYIPDYEQIDKWLKQNSNLLAI